MKALVRFLLICSCTKLIASKPQLQEQLQYHLDPLNEPQFEYPSKDPGKRTIGSYRHYAFGKHVGIHPHGYRYVLGYSPINVKYVPVIKPVTVLKPVLQSSIRPSWKPIRQYLPPVHHVDHGWKPIAPVVKPVVPVVAPVHHPKPWIDEQIHTVFQEPVAPVVKPVVPLEPAPVHVPVPVKPIHNYFYFQTPIARPALVPQVPFLHVPRPQLPVLPLGATFPAPVLPAHTAPGLVHFPVHSPSVSVPVPVHPAAPVFPVHHHPHPVAPVFPVHHHPQPVTPVFPVHHHHHPQHVAPVLPVHHHPQPAAPVFPVHHHPQPVAPAFPHHHAPVPAPHPPVAAAAPPGTIPGHPQPAAFPPISIEFHGNHHLLHQFPITGMQSPVLVPAGRQPHALAFTPEVHTNFVPQVTHMHPVGNPQVTHLHPIGNPQIPVHHPPEVQDHGDPQPRFNPEAAIQPGQTDLQVPLHLPHHPHFRQVHGFEHQQPTHFDPQFPPFQNPGNIRPSVSLEPPLTHGHTR